MARKNDDELSKDHLKAFGTNIDLDPLGADDVMADSSVITGENPDLEILITDDIFEEEEVEEVEETEEDDDFDKNLAEELDESYLNTIADDVIRKVKIDAESRRPHLERYQRGVEALGVTKKSTADEPFKGAAQVSYPLLMDGVIQFQARALGEIFPATGPVKADILGESNAEIEEQGERVADYLNYQILEEDEAYFDETDQMLLMLPIAGSCFKKTYYDYGKDTIVSKLIKIDDFIVPYTASCLVDAPRFTHILRPTQNEMKKDQQSGFYRTTVLSDPQEGNGSVDTDEIKNITDEVDGKEKILDEGDDRHTVYETCIDYDIKGFEDKDEKGEDTGIARPYIISVDVSDGTVLSIRRNWKKDDDRYRRKEYVTHFKYLPGIGFYGMGLYHTIGGLTDAATGAVRALLDSAAFATMQGGFKSKDVSMSTSGEITLTPGVYHDIGLTSDELSKAFYTPPFKEPSMALFKLLELLISAGEKTSSLTEALLGSGGANTPVGTELARIEQGSKVHTAIHKRIHKAAGKEFKLRAALNHEYLGDDDYPYLVVGAERTIRGSDFDERIDVVPVSDPNMSSASLKIAKAQVILQMMEMNPELYDTYEVHKNMHIANGVDNIDDFLIDRQNLPRLDVISQIQAIMMQKDVKAHPEQDHTAHIKVITAWMQNPNFGGDDYIKQLTMPRILALLAEHKAYEFGQLMGQNGAQVAMVDLSVRGSNSILVEEQDIDTENAITQSAMQAIEGFMQSESVPIVQGGGEQEPSPEQQKMAAEQAKTEASIAAKQAVTESDIANKQATTQADIANKQALTQAELDNKAKNAQAEQELKDYQTERGENRKDVEGSNKARREVE